MGWMAWTTQTAFFFAGIGLALLIMTAWELARPTQPRRGFLPMVTTRGDRFFISLLCAAFIHLLWLGTVVAFLPAATVLSAIWAFALMRWG